MKVKFTDWSYVDSDGFFNDDDELYEISVNEGDWYFEVDGKDYCWSVRREEYLEEDGGGKGDGFWVIDLNDNDKVLVDSRWVDWGLDDCEFRSITEKFNDEMSVKEFMLNVSEVLDEEDIYIFSVEEIDYDKEKLIGKEIEI